MAHHLVAHKASKLTRHGVKKTTKYCYYLLENTHRFYAALNIFA